MKYYDKQFENYFRSDGYKKHYDKQEVDIVGRDFDKYTNEMRAILDGFYSDIWRNGLNLAWVSDKFVYEGEHRDDLTDNGTKMNTAWKLFLRNMFNKDSGTLVDFKAIKIVASYAEEFYPGFYTGNPPWEENYSFPYDHINLDYLIAVWRLDDRKEMLDFAEKQKMDLDTFYDWVLNWICCYNEEHGETYTMKKSPYVVFKEL